MTFPSWEESGEPWKKGRNLARLLSPSHRRRSMHRIHLRALTGAGPAWLALAVTRVICVRVHYSAVSSSSTQTYS